MKRVVIRTAAASMLLIWFFMPIGNTADASSPEYETVQILEEDTTGDAEKEKIKILGDEAGHGYTMEIVHKDGAVYRLQADEKFKSLGLGLYTSFYALKVIIVDVNRDGVPEIITVGSGTHEVPFHVFRWDGSGYRRIFSSWTYSTFSFKDITGDDVPEIIIYDRLYGTGIVKIYYSWKDGDYSRIYFEMDAARGFDQLKDVLMMINNGAFPYRDDIPERDELLMNYFTAEWVSNKNNIKQLEQWNKGLLSIQIVDFSGIDEKYDPQYPGRVIEEKWKFKAKAFRVKDSRMYVENLIMEVNIKPVPALGENNWRIDDIKFSNS